MAALATVDNLPEKAKNMLQTRPVPELTTDAADFYEAVQEISSNVMAIQILVERTDAELTDLMTSHRLSVNVLDRLSAPDRASLLGISDHRVPTLANWFEFICRQVHEAYVSMEPLRCDDQGDFVQGEADRITSAYRKVYGMVLGAVPNFTYSLGSCETDDNRGLAIFVQYGNNKIGRFDCAVYDGAVVKADTGSYEIAAKMVFCMLCEDVGVERASRASVA
ncbi:MAG: hypothetical protein UW65_C0030G0009 [candidate division WWE3 bacterium GW2011_GWB1_44_4]|uniref:Uncharacterized protein n=1 Tax=candidate division WWE3 bacterium GW2011_GWB1_44_4 TaxID=1619116 RepID=A0A0G1MAU3_UNCKA|nr:MAG: hypothetical protein UW65_C0030G0009 [candidate division WWE3 bacterium GW2011_GWB1_44_4]